MIDHDDPRVQLALRLLGVPYVYGAGDPSDGVLGDGDVLARGVTCPRSNGRRGWDCSGSVLAYLVCVGDLSSTARDINAHGIANHCDPVSEADLRAGDLVFYDANDDAVVEHVAIYIGDGMCVTMSGGRSTTFGDDPRACGKVLPVSYQPVLCYGRWRA